MPTQTASQLRTQIAAWNGKSSDDIEAVFQCFKESTGFSAQLVKLCDSTQLQPGATWLLKRWLEDGNTLPPRSVSALINRFSKLEDPQAILHALQSLPFISVNETHRSKLEGFVRDKLSHPNKFVKAWAYNGFFELQCHFPQYSQEAAELFEMGLRDEPPAVKARLRNILKKFNKP